MSDDIYTMWVYDLGRSVPDDAIKPISGGTYAKAGLSDVNTQWRIQRMTEIFGPCGSGWNWTPVEVWTDHGCVFAHVTVAYRTQDGSMSDPIHGYGGTILGGDNSDIYKKTFTDAIGNALRYLGIGADVWYKQGSGKNQFDTKYSVPQTPAPKAEGSPADPKYSPATEVQKAKIRAKAGNDLRAIQQRYGDNFETMSMYVASRVLEKLAAS